MNNRLLVTLSLLFATIFSVSANPIDTLSVSATVCDSVGWFGVMYKSDTVVTLLVTHEEGRDTFYIMTLHVNYSVHTDIYDTACSSYEWQGQTYSESGDYEVGRYPASGGCDSVVTLHLTIVSPPEMHAIVGDTFVCRNQNVEYYYPNDDLEHYWYLWYIITVSPTGEHHQTPMGTNISTMVWNTGEGDAETVTVGMYVANLQYECLFDTTISVQVCGEASPDRAEIVRKSTSNILVCSDMSDASELVHYRWGYTDKNTLDEASFANWDLNYYRFDIIDTNLFRYWVETYVNHGDVSCRNRSYYSEEADSGTDENRRSDVMASLHGDQLALEVDNPSGKRAVALLYDLSGKVVDQWDLGNESAIRRQLPFNHPVGTYLLTVQANDRRYTTKIFRAL